MESQHQELHSGVPHEAGSAPLEQRRPAWLMLIILVVVAIAMLVMAATLITNPGSLFTHSTR